MKLSFATAGALLACALAGCSKPGPVTLLLNPKPGDVISYTTTISGAVKATTQATFTVVKSDDKQVVFERRMTGYTLNGVQQPDTFFKNLVLTITQDRTGHILKTDVTGVPDAQHMKEQGAASFATFPGHPVNIGDSWKGETEMQGKKVPMTYKLADVGSVNGVDCAVLEATPEPNGNLKLDGPLTIAVEVTTGMPVKESAQMKLAGGDEISFAMVRS